MPHACSALRYDVRRDLAELSGPARTTDQGRYIEFLVLMGVSATCLFKFWVHRTSIACVGRSRINFP